MEPPFPQADALITDNPDGGEPWEDITERVRGTQIVQDPSPFVDDRAYEGFFDSLFRALHRSSPRHILLVRERGVGEQTVVIDLARRTVLGQPHFIAQKRVAAVDHRRLASEHIGATLRTLFGRASSQDDLILCVDGFVNLLRSFNYADNRAATLGQLSRARCRVIGIITPYEYEEQFATDPEAAEMFSVVRLHEPEIPVAEKLVRHFADGLQSHYKLVIDADAIHRAVALSSVYILHERLPQKAVKILHGICDDFSFDRTQLGLDRTRIGDENVIAKVAQITGIPSETLAGVGDRVDYREALRDLIVGQEQAVNEIATELGLIKAGLVDPGKPASVMLFVGQTGTGKTEMAKALARLYSFSKRLKTFTLGNFSEPHSVSGIIGVPPGYVGHDQGGRLVNELNTDPYGVFLLDEADKAHPDVMQPFLNLFDEGWIFDQRGVKAFADRAIFVLTTNVGQRQIADMCKQGKTTEEITWTMKESLSRIRHTKSNRPVFTPEFLARIKRVIVFRSLDATAMRGICQKLVADMSRGWFSKCRKFLEVSAPLVDALARVAFAIDEKAGGKEGGRIVRKLLTDVVDSQIQLAISLNPEEYRSCQRVHVDFTPAPDKTSADANKETACNTETVTDPKLIAARVTIRFN